MPGNPTALAAFQKTGEIPLATSQNHSGIVFDGLTWHISNALSNTFRNYDAGFNFISETIVLGVGDMRGITFDPNSGNIFVSDDLGGIVREVTLAGIPVNQFDATTAPRGANALSYDARDDTIWLAFFDGTIQQRSRTGSLISMFNTPHAWSGLALDTANNTLLALEDNDTLYEYQADGTLIGQIITSDQIQNNGFGIEYDSSIGRLYTTSQTPGVITIFDDPSRAIPEPTRLTLLAVGGVAVLRRR